jgi:hypothetical protein
MFALKSSDTKIGGSALFLGAGREWPRVSISAGVGCCWFCHHLSSELAAGMRWGGEGVWNGAGWS